MKNKFSFLLLLLPLLFASCSTDLDVTGTYKETMVVYGLLDQAQAKQYIKINKAFLGQGSATEMAQIKDSSQYVNALNVTLQEIKNNSVINSYHLSPDNTLPKDAGVFYGPDQNNAIYSLATPFIPDVTTPNPNDSINSILHTNMEYRLVVKNNETGVEVSSQTSLISDFAFNTPASNGTTFAFYNNQSQIDIYHFSADWASAKNGRAHQLTIRFNYTDSTALGNVSRHIDWVFPEHLSGGLSGGELMKENFLGKAFFQFVGSTLQNSNLAAQSGVIARIAGNVELRVVVGSDDLQAFIDVSKPSTGIIQEKPQYSNITNGLGIFSARYNKNPRFCSMNRPMNVASINYLTSFSNPFCNNLKFVR